MRIWRILGSSALVLAALVSLPDPAQAQEPRSVQYTMQAGDTLYDLAQEYFVSEAVVDRVLRLNRIPNARRIPIGSVIEVPRALLRTEPVVLRILSFRGEVTIEQDGSLLAPQAGLPISQGAVVSTRSRAFISLGGEGSTRVSLPSNSRVRIERARRYRIDNSLDVDVRVLRGRSEIVAPKLREGESFQTGTPVAVTAVRGTQFRVAFSEADARAFTEVVDGLVRVSAGNSSVSPAAGSGVASSTSGVGNLETLLRAPALVDPGAIQTKKTVLFSIDPLDDALAYRTQIARDAGFTDILNETISSTPTAEFEGVSDGRLFVRSRGIAESGLEGLSKVYSFRRKRLGVAAAVEPAPFEDAYKFAWLTEGEGKSFAAFQLWRKDQPSVMMVDKVGLGDNGLYISDIAPGVYTWRVATFQIDEGEVIKVWGEPQDLTVTD